MAQDSIPVEETVTATFTLEEARMAQSVLIDEAARADKEANLIRRKLRQSITLRGEKERRLAHEAMEAERWAADICRRIASKIPEV